jgi:hypothetical protein
MEVKLKRKIKNTKTVSTAVLLSEAGRENLLRIQKEFTQQYGGKISQGDLINKIVEQTTLTYL